MTSHQSGYGEKMCEVCMNKVWGGESTWCDSMVTSNYMYILCRLWKVSDVQDQNGTVISQRGIVISKACMFTPNVTKSKVNRVWTYLWNQCLSLNALGGCFPWQRLTDIWEPTLLRDWLTTQHCIAFEHWFKTFFSPFYSTHSIDYVPTAVAILYFIILNIWVDPLCCWVCVPSKARANKLSLLALALFPTGCHFLFMLIEHQLTHRKLLYSQCHACPMLYKGWESNLH